MGKVDTTGFDAVLAAIPKGQLSERQQRIAAGMAMVREGRSYRTASMACGIPISTLHHYVSGSSSLEREQGFERPLKDVNEQSFDIAQLAGEAIVESLTKDRDAWKPGDLVKAYGVAVDKINAMSGQSAAVPNGIAEALGKLLDKGDVTLRRHRPGDDALEVEAERLSG